MANTFFDSLKEYNVEPLWTVMSSMVPPVPKPKAVPFIWKYQAVRPKLIEAGEQVPAEEAERRVLMLINPALKAPQTTDTLYAGLQLINPGETAPAHRHRAFALRFIIEGEGGFTAVEGEKLYMKRGDVILTPRWTWHDHGKEGNGPMIWLDGLDLPVFQSIPVNFAEMYESDRYPSIEKTTETPLKYSWDEVQKKLDATKGGHAIYTYRLRGSNVPLSSVIGAEAERVDNGVTTEWRQETCSFVFHVYEGKGRTVVQTENEEKIVEWEKADTFCVPSWAKFRHVAEGTTDSPAYLFSFSDKPLLDNLAFYRANSV